MGGGDTEGRRFQSTGSSSFIDHLLQKHRRVKCLHLFMFILRRLGPSFYSPATSSLTSQQSFGCWSVALPHVRNRFHYSEGPPALALALEQRARSSNTVIFLSRSLTCTLAWLFPLNGIQTLSRPDVLEEQMSWTDD